MEPSFDDVVRAIMLASVTVAGLWFLSGGKLLENNGPDPRNHRGFMNHLVVATTVLLDAAVCLGVIFLFLGYEVVGAIIILIGVLIYVVRWSLGIRSL